MSLHIPNHHQTLYFTLTIPVKWLEFSQAPQVGARTVEGRSLPIDVQYVGQRKQGNIFSMSRHIAIHHQTLYSRVTIPVQYILDESTHFKPSSNIMFYADNAGTMARIFTGSPSRHKNTRRPVITNRYLGQETRKYILDASTHSKPSPNIIFYADNAGTIARFFTGSPDRCKNTRGPVISRGGIETKTTPLTIWDKTQYVENYEGPNQT